MSNYTVSVCNAPFAATFTAKDAPMLFGIGLGSAAALAVLFVDSTSISTKRTRFVLAQTMAAERHANWDEGGLLRPDEATVYSPRLEQLSSDGFARQTINTRNPQRANPSRSFHHYFQQEPVIPLLLFDLMFVPVYTLSGLA
ncbi:uncharacterized protein P174DRAFT_417969 [Aspergillus novofumigatus IBT 16806]|uniref:Transmembrane protein n=1 Tax=Aspergillus novofumigatus (strain IBT 16806) TaxID=1392255 RepID=A0A2I1CH88_ASPN1|nr:uncharacterized protein P174DRAFT_417969 [Aspergillus novofumigatus IBT 16806]PKX96988.1 hypothetical protein P174DRAFT_417969 [Aspergillus novofumigatus IBT 16806]